jgi:arylsulfatase A-like enzyme
MFSCFVLPFGLLAAPSKPNVIFILADDLGIGNVGCYGSDNYKTANIDKLAAGGIRFTQSFTAALCGPSRAVIMTGRYAFRNGSTNQDACMVMQNAELQLARTFKNAGYMASFIGKWGQLPGEPDDAGFDDYLRFNGSGVYINKKPDKPEQYRVNRKFDKFDKFDKLDKQQVGKLTREHFIQSQSDADAAVERFRKYDVNQDGFLSRDEFIHRGKK